MTGTPAVRHRGDVIVMANAIGTAAFTVTALTAATVFSTVAQWVGAITAMSLFAVGVFTFLWAFYNAAQRSRIEQLSVMQLFFLVGTPTPSRIRRTMNVLLIVQVGVGLGTALARPNGPDGTPGSSLAVGILVPMFGLGLNGLWAAFHGDFPPLERPGLPTASAIRDHPTNDPADDGGPDDDDVTGGGAPSSASIDQNGPHG
ncbi:MAG: hypothetical protein AAGF73_01680 [Actinomycetota bacterium]